MTDRRADAIGKFGQAAAELWAAGIETLDLDKREREAVEAAKSGRGEVRVTARLGAVLVVAVDVVEGMKVTRIFQVHMPPAAMAN